MVLDADVEATVLTSSSDGIVPALQQRLRWQQSCDRPEMPRMQGNVLEAETHLVENNCCSRLCSWHPWHEVVAEVSNAQTSLPGATDRCSGVGSSTMEDSGVYSTTTTRWWSSPSARPKVPGDRGARRSVTVAHVHCHDSPRLEIMSADEHLRGEGRVAKDRGWALTGVAQHAIHGR